MELFCLVDHHTSKHNIRTDDHRATALGLNHIGVSYHYAGKYELAAEFHLRHANTANGSYKVLGLCNEGLAWRALGDYEKAESCHRRALDLSLSLHDRGGETLATGQLGLDSVYSRSETSEEEGKNASLLIFIIYTVTLFIRFHL